MNRIYCAIGKIMEVTQKIELDINDICELSEIIKEFARHDKMTQADLDQVVGDAAYLKNKMETMTFGERVHIVQESRSLSKEETGELRTLLEKRNYFTHEYFKYTNFGNPPSESMIQEEFEAIKVYLRSLNSMLSRLEIIKSGLVERLRFLKSKSGLQI